MKIAPWRQRAIAEQALDREHALLEALDLDTLAPAMPCLICGGEYDPSKTRLRQGRHGMVCPACVDTARGQQELETVDQRERRLFGVRPRRRR